jgi:hypothetical protein
LVRPQLRNETVDEVVFDMDRTTLCTKYSLCDFMFANVDERLPVVAPLLNASVHLCPTSFRHIEVDDTRASHGTMPFEIL